MATTKAYIVLTVVLLLSTVTFAALFAWQFVEDDEKENKPNSTNQPLTEAPVTQDGCPFYPSPQAISTSINQLTCVCSIGYLYASLFLKAIELYMLIA